MSNLKQMGLAIMIDGRGKSMSRTYFEFHNVASAQDFVDQRHSGSINVLFADGHVGFDKVLQRSDAEIDEIYRWGINQKYWPR